MKDNLGALIEKRKERLAWLLEMFSAKKARLLFGVWTLAVFLLGYLAG